MYKWDFSRMVGAEEGAGAATVEFRQPPGSVGAGEAVEWVTLAVAFVAGAVVGGGTGMDGEEGGSVGELWDLLACGAGALGWEGLGGVEGLFERVG